MSKADFLPDPDFDAFVRDYWAVVDKANFYRKLALRFPTAKVSDVLASTRRQGLKRKALPA